MRLYQNRDHIIERFILSHFCCCNVHGAEQYQPIAASLKFHRRIRLFLTAKYKIAWVLTISNRPKRSHFVQKKHYIGEVRAVALHAQKSTNKNQWHEVE